MAIKLSALAKALKIEYSFDIDKINDLRFSLGVGIETAQELILGDLIIERIEELVEKIESIDERIEK